MSDKIFGFAMFFVGGLMVLFPLKGLAVRLFSRTWKRVEGEIIRSELVVKSLSGTLSRLVYMHDVKVGYEWEGRRYESVPVAYVPKVFYDEGKIRALCQALPVGRKLSMRVNPRHPERVVIEGYFTLLGYLPWIMFGGVLIMVPIIKGWISLW